MPEFLKQNFSPAGVILVFQITATLIGGFIAVRFVDSALKRLKLLIPHSDALGITRAEQRGETLRHIIRSVTRVVVVVVVILTITSQLGFNIAPLIFSASIIGVAIGFGAQSVVKDLIAGFFILLEDQFGVGDVIRIEKYSGVVERMTLRATVLRNLEGQVHVIPNGTIQGVTVLTKEWARAVVDVTVSYEEDLQKVFRVLQSVADGLHADWRDRVVEKPTLLGVEQLGQHGVTLRCFAKTPPMKQWEVMREWRRRIKDEFDRQGIEFAVAPVLERRSKV
jgi:moderate conductance mechanosensitive channel